ncbi:hypothetical protein L6452_12467 [Arctium lappa]|uniref:Uncharacterized protein n=1 Tax=Arctium lappa TaxID=4217 RepID=A0ACB9DRP3_ARCLA|nr:hypothetical protein L6452_12467 [Arctium lappa]
METVYPVPKRPLETIFRLISSFCLQILLLSSLPGKMGLECGGVTKFSPRLPVNLFSDLGKNRRYKQRGEKSGGGGGGGGEREVCEIWMC